MLDVLTKIPLYRLAYATGWPRLLPLNLTVSVTYRCNSRCLTCGVYNRKAHELSAEEFDRIFCSLGHAPYWYTMSGGEPFLRTDLPDICESAYTRGSPGIINIPTNGLLTARIPEMVDAIAARCPRAQIIINLSIDGVGEEHDRIRGVQGAFDRVVETYRSLRSLSRQNLALGVHTVISVHNVDRIPAIYDYVTRELKPDAFITEIAEERVELDTLGAGITPDAASYGKAVEYLTRRIAEGDHKGISRVTQSFRRRYYELVKRFLETGLQPVPCYAGVASAQIAPDGDVWFCCVRAKPVGNLRDADYDFARVWFSEEARRERARIKSGACACPLANAAYTNMLMHVPTVTAVGLEVALQGVGRKSAGRPRSSGGEV
jgi:MoaA/NifB/PqqE/SkfB family radical SAM enzyme